MNLQHRRSGFSLGAFATFALTLSCAGSSSMPAGTGGGSPTTGSGGVAGTSATTGAAGTIGNGGTTGAAGTTGAIVNA